MLPPTHHRASFEGPLPSFKTYGALVMLVPSLEVLLLGFDVVYFDLDLVLTQDPLPALATGRADLRVSFEQRTCVFPTQWARQARTRTCTCTALTTHSPLTAHCSLHTTHYPLTAHLSLAGLLIAVDVHWKSVSTGLFAMGGMNEWDRLGLGLGLGLGLSTVNCLSMH